METRNCFLAYSRPCAKNCMAYNDGECMVLVNLSKIPQKLDAIERQIDWLVTAKQDEQRTNQPPPPKVR